MTLGESAEPPPHLDKVGTRSDEPAVGGPAKHLPGVGRKGDDEHNIGKNLSTVYLYILF